LAFSLFDNTFASLSSGETYAYDANGNMTSRVEGGVTYTQTFDAENRLISVTVNSQTTTFVYDGDGNLVKKIAPDGKVTVYIGGIYEVDLNGTTVTKTTLYYPAAGAVRVIQGGNNNLYYVLKDHLGSASVTLDASGNVVANGEQRYYPFGESRLTGAALPTDRLYTGQRDVGLGGLYHYNARFYLPKLGRFISADTIVPELGNPQALNRYAYVYNNPVRYTDPSGHCVGLLIIGCIALFVVVVVGIPVVAHAIEQPATYAAYGLGPDPTGVTIANDNKQTIQDAAAAAGFEHPTALAAGIAVQSQWSGLDVIDQFRSDEASLGWGQIKKREANDFPYYRYGYDPGNNFESAIALANKMKYGLADCSGCSTTDMYIAMAISQNDKGAYAPKVGENRDWYAFFDKAYPASLQNRWRTIFRPDSKWPRFQLRQFTSDLQALHNLGWDLPPDLNLNYMNCFADGGKDCKP